MAQIKGAAVYSALPYNQFGYLPGVAQQQQATPWIDPKLNPQPYFSAADYAAAQWFTTRVHLSPTGKVTP